MTGPDDASDVPEVPGPEQYLAAVDELYDSAALDVIEEIRRLLGEVEAGRRDLAWMREQLDSYAQRIGDRRAQPPRCDVLATGFAETVIDIVIDRISDELDPYSPQGWHEEEIHPAWSGFCWHGDHEQCNGTAPPSPICHCPHHTGGEMPRWGYRLRFDDHGRVQAEPRTGPPPTMRERGEDFLEVGGAPCAWGEHSPRYGKEGCCAGPDS